MCGNIKKLRFADRPATNEEIDAAVLQYLRKISNLRKQPETQRAAFEAASKGIFGSVRAMLDGFKARRAEAVESAFFKPISAD